MPPEVAEKFQSYPESMRDKLMVLRTLIMEVAEDASDVDALEETLKWGEPSYVSSIGSTVRIDWKTDTPDNYYMFFNCNTTLVETFRRLYEGVLEFEGNRAIVFHRDDKLPIAEVQHCVSLALRYHEIKHLPMLGV